MPDMSFHQPRTLDAALKLLASHEDARPLAGGATLVAMMNAGLADPPVLVSLRHIKELKAVKALPEGGLRLGAMILHRDLANEKRLKGGFALLREAAGLVAVPPVRNMGTLGGATAFADPAADYPPALVALDATIDAASAKGRRAIAAQDFFVDWYAQALEPGEMIAAITLPALPKNAVGVYEKLAKVTGDLAIVAIALVLALDKGVVAHLGVAVGGCGPKPVTAPAAVQAMIGKPIDDASIARLGEALAEAADPVDDVRASADYRRLVLPRMLAKAFARAALPAKERR
jgi:carbon-monoxide dehydrogenase medium subunit